MALAPSKNTDPFVHMSPDATKQSLSRAAPSTPDGFGFHLSSQKGKVLERFLLGSLQCILFWFESEWAIYRGAALQIDIEPGLFGYCGRTKVALAELLQKIAGDS